MRAGEPSAGRAAVATGRAGRPSQRAARVTVLVLGLLVLALMIADGPLAALAHQGLSASNGSLPLGWVTLLAQPTWAPAIVLFGLAVLLFPDGRPPSPWMRWMVRACWPQAWSGSPAPSR